MKSAEVYDVVQNSWKYLPDMPNAGQGITCVRVQNKILISSLGFGLVSYDVGDRTYLYVGLQSNSIVDRNIASSKDKLYLFQATKIFEMNMQYEVLDTINTHEYILTCYQRFTTKEGNIFLIDSRGIVQCFDPYRKKVNKSKI